MVKPKGGRGKLTQYGSEMIRIPEPIKDRVLKLKEMFYNDELESYDEKIANDARLAREYQNLLSRLGVNDSNAIASLEDAKKLAKKIVASSKQKPSTKLLMINVISGLFGVQIDPDQL